ncbi:hypothetical protein RMATCC62417_02663 [Rhizopus microsporus]|nr:hypothetical protein RMATCC62417_02663 [Rhizopus microsporus]CEI91928.1 hypothetical protein RMCBS344292_06204 [Rhizopus microsporus]
MRKRDINKQYSPKEREQTYYLDIFEPPPTWRPHSHSNYYPPTHRSPLHHQPSLSEIVYQDYTDNHIVYRRSMLDSSSSLHYQEYDSDFDDSQQEIKTADDMSMFTAAEDVPDEDIIRHGHLPTAQEVEIINNFMKKMDIKCSAEWKDYKSQYCLLNESYDIERKRIYKEIVTALGKIQEVDARVDKVKFEFQAKMDTKYQELHENLIEQCKQVIHEAKEQKAHQLRQANEIKIQLNEKVKDINTIY